MIGSEAKTFIKKLHPNLWTGYRKEYEETGQIKLYHDRERAQYKNISKIFGPEELDYIKDCLDNKRTHSAYKYYHGSRPQVGRDFSIELYLDKNGNYCGTFSSEYAGYGNGDYFILVNATTALFIEKD